MQFEKIAEDNTKLDILHSLLNFLLSNKTFEVYRREYFKINSLISEASAAIGYENAKLAEVKLARIINILCRLRQSDQNDQIQSLLQIIHLNFQGIPKVNSYLDFIFEEREFKEIEVFKGLKVEGWSFSVYVYFNEIVLAGSCEGEDYQAAIRFENGNPRIMVEESSLIGFRPDMSKIIDLIELSQGSEVDIKLKRALTRPFRELQDALYSMDSFIHTQGGIGYDLLHLRLQEWIERLIDLIKDDGRSERAVNFVYKKLQAHASQRMHEIILGPQNGFPKFRADPIFGLLESQIEANGTRPAILFKEVEKLLSSLTLDRLNANTCEIISELFERIHRKFINPLDARDVEEKLISLFYKYDVELIAVVRILSEIEILKLIYAALDHEERDFVEDNAGMNIAINHIIKRLASIPNYRRIIPTEAMTHLYVQIRGLGILTGVDRINNDLVKLFTPEVTSKILEA